MDPFATARADAPANRGYDVLKKTFFTSSPASQAVADVFTRRLAMRTGDLDPPSGPTVATAQMAAFREWETFSGSRFADLKAVQHHPGSFTRHAAAFLSSDAEAAAF